MRKDFVNEVSKLLRIERKDLIEKDLILHQILTDLSKDNFYSSNFLFKGGTCLIKYYLGYFRFSEDIDFTWRDQKVFESLSQNEIRRRLSQIIKGIGKLFERISTKRGFDFKCVKSDRRYVELTGGNKTATFKIWFRSEILERESFIKIQINFVDKLRFRHGKRKLRSLVSGAEAGELKLLFPDYSDYFKTVTLDVYDVKEILAEKVRAILTRKGVKTRDYVDVYMISKRFGIDVNDLDDAIIEKTEFMLKNYERFRRNFALKWKNASAEEKFDIGREKNLLISDIDDNEFDRFVADFTTSLRKIVGRISG